MRVREARAEDAAEVFALARDFATSYEPEWPSFIPAFERILAGGNGALLVADSDGVIAGYVLVHVQETLFANAPTAYVQELMVADAHRRGGVGAALMAACEKWAREAGCVYVALATRRASDFYRAVGYVESAEFYKKEL